MTRNVLPDLPRFFFIPLFGFGFWVFWGSSFAEGGAGAASSAGPNKVIIITSSLLAHKTKFIYVWLLCIRHKAKYKVKDKINAFMCCRSQSQPHYLRQNRERERGGVGASGWTAVGIFYAFTHLMNYDEGSSSRNRTFP